MSAPLSAFPVPWKRVAVFVSSTFSDMHAERDYLVKRVFPDLHDWCERRRWHVCLWHRFCLIF